MLETRGQIIREPFNAMMERKQERYAFLLGLEKQSREGRVDPKQLKKEIKELETFIEYSRESIDFWDFKGILIERPFSKPT